MDTTETTTQTTRIMSASDLLARYAAGERDFYGAELSGAYLSGADLPTGSHDVIAELLRRAAGDDIARCSIAGLVLLRRDWCWREFGEIAHTHWNAEQRAWIVAALEPWPVFAPVLRRYGFVDGAATAEAEE